MRLALALAALVIAALPARADFFNGAAVLPYCETDKSFVYAYVAGATDGFGADIDSHRSKICVPSEVTIRQLGDQYCQYLTDNPADIDEPASSLVFGMLFKKYRCER